MKNQNGWMTWVLVGLVVVMAGCNEDPAKEWTFIDSNESSEETVSEPPPGIPEPDSGAAGFAISTASGNTAGWGSAAQFSVALTGKPSSNVTIPLSSSDDNEGLLRTTQLVFTPQNWFVPQTVTVNGNSADDQNGTQNYFILLHPAQSKDRNYDGLDPHDVPMRGVVLELSPPLIDGELVAGQARQFYIDIYYTGSSRPRFELMQAPAGMTIEAYTGLITWGPPSSAAGTRVYVEVSAKDDVRHASTFFEVPVAQTTPVQTQIRGNELVVTDSGRQLQGVAISTGNINELSRATISVVEDNAAPSISENIIRISEFFTVSPIQAAQGYLTIRLPREMLPPDRDLSDLMLYEHTNRVTNYTGYLWAPNQFDLEVSETTDNSGDIIFKVKSIEGINVIGLSDIPAQELEMRSAAAQSRTYSTMASDSYCSKTSSGKHKKILLVD